MKLFHNCKELSKKLLSPLSYGVRAVIFSVLLALINTYWPLLAIIFILIAFYFYLRPSLNTAQFFSSFLAPLVISLLIITYLPIANSYWLIIFAVFFGFLFYFILGIKNLIFVNRQNIYHILNSFLFLTIFILFFNTDKSVFFVFKYLLTGLGIFFLFREFLMLGFREFIGFPKSLNLISTVFAFLSLQIIWVVSLLPIGFLNAAALVLMIILVLKDFTFHHLSGTINRRIVLRNTTIFLVLSVIIFAVSKWTP